MLTIYQFIYIFFPIMPIFIFQHLCVVRRQVRQKVQYRIVGHCTVI